ncbi:ricin B lectin (RBL2) [Vairimorpha necatrix]|uniref:Ricin B lectin (RBL2) n=1 Tax=Vairimorpha necatrix TaxID=6039 RepID=A0AAX4JF91_9MICR
MIFIFINTLIAVELTEKGYLYSIGEQKFLSLDFDHIRLLPRHTMPQPFEIEQREGDETWKLKIMPSPRKKKQVIDKDWWTNDHRLISHEATEWESEKFIFSLQPKNLIKIVVKEDCIQTEDKGYVRAMTCNNDDKQLFRWIPDYDRGIVEEFVERHGGVVNLRRGVDQQGNPLYENNYGLIDPSSRRPDSIGRMDDGGIFIPPPRGLRRRNSDFGSSNRSRRKSYDPNCDFISPGGAPGYRGQGSYNNDRNDLYGLRDPRYGGRDPRYGNDSYGLLDPRYGNRNDSYGLLDPRYGNRNDSYGLRDPRYGNRNDSYGLRDPRYGNRNDYYGGGNSYRPSSGQYFPDCSEFPPSYNELFPAQNVRPIYPQNNTFNLPPYGDPNNYNMPRRDVNFENMAKIYPQLKRRPSGSGGKVIYRYKKNKHDISSDCDSSDSSEDYSTKRPNKKHKKYNVYDNGCNTNDHLEDVICSMNSVVF